MTYVNTSFFALSLVPIVIHLVYDRHRSGLPIKIFLPWKRATLRYSQINDEDNDSHLKPDDEVERSQQPRPPVQQIISIDSLGSCEALDSACESSMRDYLSVKETAKLSLEFCIIWVSETVPPLLPDTDIRTSSWYVSQSPHAFL